MKKMITISMTIDELTACNGKITLDLSQLLSQPQTQQKTPETTVSFCHFMEQTISTMDGNRKPRTIETYRTTLNSLRRFLDGNDIGIGDISASTLDAYEQWLQSKGIKQNSTSFYMRKLRAVYRRAVREELTPDRHPFENVYTGMARTVKRAVDITVIRQLAAMNITDRKSAFARDMFMFSFFTQGMAFIDMAYLKATNIKNGILTYQRQKTGQTINIKWIQPMQQIVDRYAKAATSYLLPIIGKGRGTERSKFRACQCAVNNNLKELSAQLGLQQHITMYVARHSWASIARSINIPIDIISQGMGHHNESTTHIYLKEIDTGRMAEANQRVINLL